MFDFSNLLSQSASKHAEPFSGYPAHHFVGGNIDEPTVPVEALADAVSKVLRGQGNAMGKYGMNSGPQGHLPLREIVAQMLKRRAEWI